MADTTTPVANITSVSHLVAARLSPTGDPFALSTQIASNPASVSAASASAATKSVMDAMQPLASALALPSTLNPLTSPFTTNGQGFDKMLDSIDVKIEPQGQRSKLEVTVKQAVSETDALPKISFTSDGIAPVLPAVQADKLVQSGLSVLIQGLLDQLTACYSVPLSDRITSGGSAAADIRATACKEAFYNDDPTAYKSGGMIVSRSQHFGGRFVADASRGIKFSDPKFFYRVAENATGGPSQGDIVFGYRWKDELGNVQIECDLNSDSLWVRGVE